MSVEARVFKIISQVVGVAESTVTMQASPQTMPDWDSMKQIQLMLALEEEFRVRFNENQMTQLGSAEDIVSTLRSSGINS